MSDQHKPLHPVILAIVRFAAYVFTYARVHIKLEIKIGSKREPRQLSSNGRASSGVIMLPPPPPDNRMMY